ncbi:hypothetical protein [Falsirhodobacter halotolerans]|uniref:hypothetical protein n=1 Tax=Falsirhodobacter halotolerans TaxID=1146892 RepID=UPI001FD5935B|nr:hypothetical protein [Falsirhodobacter halotolerans]MCJ8141081.1 hypothetical protein [Falsirhodobacter halotolerans]
MFLLPLIALAACSVPARDPLPYSPNYQYLGGGLVQKGAASGRMVPDACITPDVAADPLYLPPGCANALNLQMMAAAPSDLMRGRTPGPAMAAPQARAARRVIDGTAPPPERLPEDGLSTTDRLN